MPKRHRQLWVKDLPKVPTCRLERESNPWPFGRKASTLPMRHTCPTTLNTKKAQNVKSVIIPQLTIIHPTYLIISLSGHKKDHLQGHDEWAIIFTDSDGPIYFETLSLSICVAQFLISLSAVSNYFSTNISHWWSAANCLVVCRQSLTFIWFLNKNVKTENFDNFL